MVLDFMKKNDLWIMVGNIESLCGCLRLASVRAQYI